jgi:hypothetical protein
MMPYYDDGGITLYHADARELEGLQEDVVLTDPPNELAGDCQWPEMHVLVSATTLPTWVLRGDLSAVTVWRRPAKNEQHYGPTSCSTSVDPEIPLVHDEGPRQTEHPSAWPQGQGPEGSDQGQRDGVIRTDPRALEWPGVRSEAK